MQLRCLIQCLLEIHRRGNISTCQPCNDTSNISQQKIDEQDAYVSVHEHKEVVLKAMKVNSMKYMGHTMKNSKRRDCTDQMLKV